MVVSVADKNRHALLKIVFSECVACVCQLFCHLSLLVTLFCKVDFWTLQWFLVLHCQQNVAKLIRLRQKLSIKNFKIAKLCSISILKRSGKQFETCMESNSKYFFYLFQISALCQRAVCQSKSDPPFCVGFLLWIETNKFVLELNL